MQYILWGILALVASILLFTVLNHILKRYRAPKTAEQGIWNAVYFIQLKQYEKALELLAATEAEYGMTPEVMCDLCIQRADAHKGLKQYAQAAEAYEVLYEALQECDGKLKRNDALLEEIRACYNTCDRSADFVKWEQLFAALPEAQ